MLGCDQRVDEGQEGWGVGLGCGERGHTEAEKSVTSGHCLHVDRKVCGLSSLGMIAIMASWVMQYKMRSQGWGFPS